MSKRLTEQDFERAANRLGCEVAAIKAVAQVESRGEGFYADGFPVILFERHIFKKYTQGRYNQSHPEISGQPGNYGKAGANQRRKFSAAFVLNPTAAMKACSWGKFQIMGFNHEVCGYATVDAFVDAMKESEGKQLDAFVEFVIGNRLGKYLKTLNWANFAEGYNGSGYAQNRYDTKMAKAYKTFSTDSAATSQKPSLGLTGATAPKDVPADSPSDQPPNIVVEKEAKPPGFFEGIKLKVATWWAMVGGMEGAKQAASDAQFLGLTADTWRTLGYIVIGIGAMSFIGYAVYYLWKYHIAPRLLTTALVQANANTSDGTTVTVAGNDTIAELEKQGFIVVRRK